MGNLEEDVSYLLGKVHELEEGEAEDKGARIENDRNREDITSLKNRLNYLENKLDNLEESIDYLNSLDLERKVDKLLEEVQS